MKKKILLIGQLTDISGYGNAVRCYLDNLIQLEKEELIELHTLNYSFEENIAASPTELDEIKKRSITNSIEHRAGMCEDQEEYDRIQKFINKKDYEVIFYLTSDMLVFGKDNDSSKFDLQIDGKPEHSGNRFNLKEICKHSKGVYQCIAWESETIPGQWARALKDEAIPVKKLLCACDWNRQSFSKLGIPAVTLPYSVGFVEDYDTSYYDKIKKATDGKFVFSSVFQWSNRKGVDILVRAFSLEFATNDDVCLLLKTYMNKAIKGAAKDEMKWFKDKMERLNSGLIHSTRKFIPKFKTIILNDLLSKPQLNSIYKASDAFILPTRGEGFCLPVAEAISYNVPAIVPEIGGHMGYINKEESSSLLIESRMEPCMNISNPFWSSITTEWVEPSLSSTRKKIRFAYENRDWIKSVGTFQNKTLRNYLSKERCVKLFKENIL